MKVSIDTINPVELPKYDDTKVLNCPAETTVEKVINYMNTCVHFEKRILCDPKTFDPIKYVELVMETGYKLPSGEPEYIVLDNNLTMVAI